jgi:ATP-dependent exoDNAse (exonuclease V) alpha subunit
MPAEHTNTLVDLLVDEVLEHRSVALASPPEGIEEPDVLRRVDGSSVYTVAGADLYTSQRILDAEQRLVTVAGIRDGTVLDRTVVDLAVLEMAANGTALDTGQASLVRQMCTSGARLQLAIAPAGAGKTTAMRALTRSWTEDGGQVIGLAPSAAAAAVLGEQTGIRTDTLAKLTWSLRNDALPDWATGVRPSTLIIIDEAGMADTSSLDTAVQFALDRGASVRLIGDDQQLAAIGAGGILRDIKNIHGALHLTELHRFTDPAEAQASLTLREGDPSALGFYLDHGRVHVGDLAKITEDALAAWVQDRSAGFDVIMLAPTRELVAELNRRARDHRRDGAPAGQEVLLGDGNRASVGDMIITRSNDRRLRLTATDWVKNGDRWTITRVCRGGGLSVRHNQSQRIIRLPADYVSTSTGLGYATTIHSAQGVSADTMHGLLTGQESRQQLYTMLTRGRHTNHLYLQVVGDGDPHSLIRPETVAPYTPTETLQQILARDEVPVSASTVLRELNSPAPRLFQAVQRYTDGLHVAAEQLLGPQTVAELDHADRCVPGLTDEPAWPTLRAHLLALAAETGEHPLRNLLTAASGRDLGTAGDMAAVLYWRLPELTRISPGPLPWLPGIPPTLHAQPVWGPYLAKRSQLVADLADQVQHHTCQGDGPPVWAVPETHLSTPVIREIAVWRAANGVSQQDRRPTGGTQLETLPALWKQRLDRDIARATNPPADARADERRAAHTALSRSDLATLTENLFEAWRADRSRGVDSVMLAPTRDLVTELNRRARVQRLASARASGPEVALADGNRASAGELIITRTNDRRLRTPVLDWVKNGDRWTVSSVDRDGGLRAKHRRSGGTVHLPASYVRASVELGYATTIHTAQGITADTMHGLITGTESRQQLYTMCTRGRLSNHMYLQLVGDGDPHTLIRPDSVRPSTATELLEQILGRDDTPRSASTLAPEQQTIRPAWGLRRALHRRTTCGGRARRRQECGGGIGGLCEPVGAWANR